MTTGESGERPRDAAEARPPTTSGEPPTPDASADAASTSSADRAHTAASADAASTSSAEGAHTAAGPDAAATSGAEPPSPGASAAGAEQARAPGPRVVKRVVCSYRLGWLPGDWLQTWRRLDRTFARANLKVKATLAPLEDLPDDTDILVVPPDLREDARSAAAPGTPILVTPASAAAGAFAELVARLEAGVEMTADRIDPDEKDKPKIVSYRGHTLLD